MNRNTVESFPKSTPYCDQQMAMNVAVVCFVVTPLTIAYWSGTWKLLDVYINPPIRTSASNSFALGAVICLLCLVISPAVDFVFLGNAPIRHALTSCLLTYSHALGVVSYWRGLWGWLTPFLRLYSVWTALAIIAIIVGRRKVDI